jgi:hypothetical protein
MVKRARRLRERQFAEIQVQEILVQKDEFLARLLDGS